MFSKSVDIKRGMVFRIKGYRFRVMTVSENYVMMRQKGCFPRVIFWKHLLRDYVFIKEG